MKKSLLALLLALCLMLSALPTGVMAEYDAIGADDMEADAAQWLALEGDLELPDDGLEAEEWELADLYGALEDGVVPVLPEDAELVFGTEDEAQPQEEIDGLSLDDTEPVSGEEALAEDAASAADEEAPSDGEETVDEGVEASEDEEKPSEDSEAVSEDEEKPADEGKEVSEDGEKPADEVKEASEDGEKPSDEDKEASEDGEKPSDEGKEASEDGEKPADEDKEASEDGEKFSDEGKEASEDEKQAVRTEQAADTSEKQAAPALAEAAAATTADPSVPAGGVSLSYKTLRIGRGESVQLYPSVGEGVTSVSYTSSKKKIVSASADGVIKGVKKGTAYVTLKTDAGSRFKLKVVVKNAPKRITANPNPLSLGVGEVYTLGYTTPAGSAAGAVAFAGDAPSVFTVDERTGVITALATGTGTVTLTTYNGKTTSCPVTVYPAPTSVAFDPNQTSVGKKQKLQLQMVFNAGAWSNVTYTVDNPAIAKVSASGVVTGKKVGQTVIHATTFVPGLTAETVFTVWGAPSKVWVDKKKITGNVGTPFQLEPKIPAGSKTTFKYKSSKKKVATVSADGVVTPLKKGKTKITITTHNKKKVTLTLTVYDPGQPSGVTLKSDETAVLYPGQTWQTEYEIKPAGADAAMAWTSSSPSVASVDQTGLVTALSYGRTTIKAVSPRNGKVTFKYTVSVQTKELSLDIPARITDTTGIAANLAKINAIKESTFYEIDRLKAAGSLTADAAARRKEIVTNIFANYAFPWMTPTKQKYWKAANSENGLKDFKVGNVYYGMPYISGSGANRRYTAALALSEGRYTDSGQGYYVLNQSKYLNGKYVGNDCSGLVNVSIWGVGSSHAADRTGDIAVNSVYTTVSSYNSLLPGDLICRADSHVVMFLYYASSDKSKIMIIENGGSEKGTNTVHCDIKTASAYKKSGYKIRRPVGL